CSREVALVTLDAGDSVECRSRCSRIASLHPQFTCRRVTCESTIQITELGGRPRLSHFRGCQQKIATLCACFGLCTHGSFLAPLEITQGICSRSFCYVNSNVLVDWRRQLSHQSDRLQGIVSRSGIDLCVCQSQRIINVVRKKVPERTVNVDCGRKVV